MCRSVVGRYRFGWIAVVERRIKRWFDGSDRRIPLRLSDWIWAVRSWSDERDSEGREAHRARLGFRRGSPVRAYWRRRPAGFWRSLDYGETTTSFRTMRWSRELDRRPRLLAEGGEGYGWSEHDAGVHRVMDDGVDLRRNGPGQLVREKCREEEESLVGEGEDRAYQRRRIRAENARRCCDSWKDRYGRLEGGWIGAKSIFNLFQF
jgi:hypothetical protein